MSGETETQLVLRADHSSLILSGARTGIIVRGRRDAAQLTASRFGPTVPVSQSRAKILAEEGDRAAQYDLGVLYEQGWQMFRWAGCDATHPGCLRAVLATESTRENLVPPGPTTDCEEAAFWFWKAAEQGHVEAAMSLGWMYAKGEGVDQDCAVAAHWYCKASIHGNVFAASELVDLGTLYADGTGVPQSDAEAARLYRVAADQGLAEAQARLAYMHSAGKGVPQNKTEAARLRRKASEKEIVNPLERAKLGCFLYARAEYIDAYVWFNAAAVSFGGESRGIALHNRDLAASQMNREELAEAQRRANRAESENPNENDEATF
jgi:TPR repeat protein